LNQIIDWVTEYYYGAKTEHESSGSGGSGGTANKACGCTAAEKKNGPCPKSFTEADAGSGWTKIEKPRYNIQHYAIRNARRN